MKLLMLCREPRLYSCVRLKEAAESSGYQIDILDPNRCVLSIDEQQQLSLFYQNSQHYPSLAEGFSNQERVQPLRKLEGYLAVIPRFGIASTQMGCNVLRYFESKNVPVLNNATAFTLARDKWRSLQVLAQHNIPVPMTIFAGLECESKQTFELLNAPLVLKTLSGSQGVGVMLAENRKSAVSIQETLKQAEIPVLAQQFISEANGQDLRCFVIGGRVVAAMQRYGQSDEFRANFHRGGSAETVLLSEQEKQIAIAAANAVGLDVAGVDIIRAKNGPLVLEVNASPGLELIEKVSKLDLALQMIVHLENKIKNLSVIDRT